MFDLRGDLYLARRGRPVTTPAPLPRQLQDTVEHPLSGIRVGAVSELKRLLDNRHAGLALAALVLRLDLAVRGLAALAALLLVVGHLMRLGVPGVRSPVEGADHVRRGHHVAISDIAVALVLAAGLLGLMQAGLAVPRSSDLYGAGFWIAAAGTFVILVAAAVELARDRTRMLAGSGVVAAILAIAGLAAFLAFPGDLDGLFLVVSSLNGRGCAVRVPQSSESLIGSAPR